MLRTDLASLFEIGGGTGSSSRSDEGVVAEWSGGTVGLDFATWGRRHVTFPDGLAPALGVGDELSASLCLAFSPASRGTHYVLELRDGAGALVFSGTSGDASTYGQATYPFHSPCLPSYAATIEHAPTGCAPLAPDAQDGGEATAMGLRLPVIARLRTPAGEVYDGVAGGELDLRTLGLRVRVEASFLRVDGACADCPPSALLLFAVPSATGAPPM